MSVLDFVHFGSSLSLRKMGRLSSGVSLCGAGRFGSQLSVLDFMMLGSSTASFHMFSTLKR